MNLLAPHETTAPDDLIAEAQAWAVGSSVES
jgi:hypothetical protein